MLLLSVGRGGGRGGVDRPAGVVGEVVSDQRVQALVLTVEVCGGDDDELSVTRGHGAPAGAPEKIVGFVGQECGGDEQDRGVVARCPLPDLVGGGVLAADEPA